jgi:hypothetical protein
MVYRGWIGADLIRFMNVILARDGKNRQPEDDLEQCHQNPEPGTANHSNHLGKKFND